MPCWVRPGGRRPPRSELTGRVGRVLARGAQRLLPPVSRGDRVLCYHLVGGGTGSVVDLPVDSFVRQLDALERMAVVVPLEELAGPRRVSASGARPRVALTFDDAFRNFADVVWPILETRRLPATLFAPTGFLNRSHPGPLAGLESAPPVSWPWLRQAGESPLLTVGSHTRTHRDLRSLPPGRLADEVGGSRRELEDRLGLPVDSFCYPRALWNERVEEVVGEHYSLAVIGGGRRLTPASHPLRIHRTSVRRDSPLPVRDWIRARIWLEEALADRVRRMR